MNPEKFSLSESPNNERVNQTRRGILTEEDKLNELLDGALLPSLDTPPEEIIDLVDVVEDGNEDGTVMDHPAIPDEGNWEEDSHGDRPTILHNPVYRR